MVQRKAHTDIIKHLYKHVSASAVRLWHINRRVPVRGLILGASLPFPCPAALKAAPRADSPSAAVTGGGTVTFMPCQASEPKSSFFFHLSCLENRHVPQQVIYRCGGYSPDPEG